MWVSAYLCERLMFGEKKNKQACCFQFFFLKLAIVFLKITIVSIDTSSTYTVACLTATNLWKRCDRVQVAVATSSGSTTNNDWSIKEFEVTNEIDRSIDEEVADAMLLVQDTHQSCLAFFNFSVVQFVRCCRSSLLY